MRSGPRTAWVLCAVPVWVACQSDRGGEAPADQGESAAEIDTQGELVAPPFDVKGGCEGLLLVWFDKDGPHTAARRDDIPEAHRARVRVDSLRLAPDERLDPEWVYVADLKSQGKRGAYPVRKLRRAAFDAIVDALSGKATGGGGEALAAAEEGADAIIYGATWCKACRGAARFFRERGVPFVEKNIEKSKSALAEMQRKARDKGVSPTGIPVIDYKGQLVLGFDARRLDTLIREGGQPI